MTIEKQGETTIRIRQGDSGELIFRGFNPDKNYNVHFSIRDENFNLMFPEISVYTNNNTAVSIMLDADSTKKLIVPDGGDVQIYYWGLKYSEAGSNEENTVFPALFKKCLVLVCPQYTEGID